MINVNAVSAFRRLCAVYNVLWDMLTLTDRHDNLVVSFFAGLFLAYCFPVLNKETCMCGRISTEAMASIESALSLTVENGSYSIVDCVVVRLDKE